MKPELDVDSAGADGATPSAWFVRSVPLGGSPLSRALQADPAMHGWLAPRPADLAGWTAHVRALQLRARETDWLTPLAPAIAATGRAAERLGRAAAHGVVVTTGQQPGLFGGPAYTFSKALSALTMADALEEATGVPIAPIFWAASDDADWVEAAVTYFATPNGLQTVSLEGPATNGIAMSDVTLGPLQSALDVLRSACGSMAHESILTVVEHAYVPHATVGTAYVQLLRATLEPLGIAVLDAAHPALRQAADPILRRALQQASAVQDALIARTAAIVAEGFTPQVDVMDALTLVFRTESGDSGRERDRVRTRVPVGDAARVVREADPATLGSNVLLRPVVERALLPTIAYHAGPGEYAYFAQVAPVAAALGLDAPIAVPRWSGEVIERRAELLRDRLGIDDASLLDPHAAETQVARAAVDMDTQDAIERLRVAIETQVRAVGDAVARADDLVMPEVVSGLAGDLEQRILRFERRVLAGTKRRETERLREVAAVRAALRPHGTSPERTLNLVPMLARYGPAVFDAMRSHARAYVERLVTAP